jgi:hypothetical protein
MAPPLDPDRTRRIRRIAAILMLLSGVTHVAQLFVYGAPGHVVGASLFGIAYFAIGVALKGQSRAALWLGAIVPAIGGTLGVIRFATVHANPFSVFHVGIDLVVIPICIYLLLRRPVGPRQEGAKAAMLIRRSQ